MSKKVETKKANDPVGEYLVNKIKELESEIKELESEREQILKYTDLLEEKVVKFEEVKKLFKLSGGCICLYNTNGEYESVVASTLRSFGKYLAELLDLKEKE